MNQVTTHYDSSGGTRWIFSEFPHVKGSNREDRVTKRKTVEVPRSLHGFARDALPTGQPCAQAASLWISVMISEEMMGRLPEFNLEKDSGKSSGEPQPGPRRLGLSVEAYWNYSCHYGHYG